MSIRVGFVCLFGNYKPTNQPTAQNKIQVNYNACMDRMRNWAIYQQLVDLPEQVQLIIFRRVV